jgi:cysteine desulfurase/selenocysteine lyase
LNDDYLRLIKKVILKNTWQSIREQFPALKDCTYLNTAASGLVPQSAVEAMHRHYQIFAEQGSESWSAFGEEIEQTRREVAAMLNAAPEEIAFIPNVASGVHYLARTFASLGKIAMVEDDFPTLRSAWELWPYELVNMPSATNGFIDLEDIRKAEAPLLAISHVQWHTGFMTKLDELAALCQEQEKILIVDASHSLGAFEIDVKTLGLDVLLATSYKWQLGGFGGALLYVSQRILDRFPVRINWNWREPEGQLFRSARRFEFGHDRYHDICRTAQGVRFLLDIGLNSVENRVRYLNGYLRKRLTEEGIPLLSDYSEENRSALTFIPGDKALLKQLRAHNIMASLRGEGLRLSLHFYNNEEDVEKLIKVEGRR